MFNLFCPLFSGFPLTYSVLFLIVLSFVSVIMMFMKAEMALPVKTINNMVYSLFPLTSSLTVFYFSGLVLFSLLNLISMVAYSYPVTTTLSFNLSLSFVVWFMSMLFLSIKTNSFSMFVPSNSPWYLISFLSLVEMVSILVRPITLCFRLLANMSAGHILLSLISKLPFSTWLMGSLFGLLELMVAMVQSFVFFMLVSVYYEESMSHCFFSFWNLTLKKLKIMKFM